MRWLGVFAFASVAVLGGCSSRPVVDAPATVVVVGDSIMFGAAGDVVAALEGDGWTVHVDGVPASTIAGPPTVESWPERLDALVREHRPDVVVVELGTNGCGECAHTSDGIDAVMERLRDVQRVYWLNVREDANIPPDPAAMNRAIDTARDRWPNLRVIDFDKRFEDHPDWLSDGVHPNARGNAELADLIAGSLPDVRARDPK